MTRRHALVAFALVLTMGPGCVESEFRANLMVTFEPSVQSPTPEGQTVENGRPPPGTYYSFYAIQYQYQTDANGKVVVDPVTGDPVVIDSYAFKVNDFEIRPLIDTASPCFIESATDRYPGLHSTRELSRLRLDTGIVNETNPDDSRNDPNASETDYIDVIGAAVRSTQFAAIQNQLRAVTSFSPAEPPGVHPDYPVGGDTECPPADPRTIPAPACIDDASNAQRLALCQEFWDRYPNFYEGNDRVFTLPLNGIWRGGVDGTNPKNGAPVGGVNFFVGLALTDFDGFSMTWQYEDRDGDGEPDYPAGTTDQQKSNIGFHYMDGTPEVLTRGTRTVHMSNRVFSLIRGTATVFSDIDEDDVHF